jgi:hypothetical protein
MGAYALLRVLTHRVARRRRDVRTFLLVELGGLGGRMALMLGVVAIVLLFLPVHPEAFAVTVCGLLVLCLGVEVGLIVRNLDEYA